MSQGGNVPTLTRPRRSCNSFLAHRPSQGRERATKGLVILPFRFATRRTAVAHSQAPRTARELSLSRRLRLRQFELGMQGEGERGAVR